MKILLTGASSGVGLKLSEKLIGNIENFSQIFLLCNPNSKFDEANFIKHEKIKLIRQNLLEPHSNELKLILNEIDFLVHYAWIRPKNPANSITHNTKIIKNIFVNLNKKVKIIFLSSVAGIPESISHYGKSKYQISKLLHNSFETKILISGLIVSENKDTWFDKMKKILEKIPILIKFGERFKVLHTSTDQVVNITYDNIFHFKKEIFKLYEDENISLDNFIKKNSTLNKNFNINISMLLRSFLFVARYINYIPVINRISDKLITVFTNDKLKTDEFIKKGF